jgi:hypothetical protein
LTVKMKATKSVFKPAAIGHFCVATPSGCVLILNYQDVAGLKLTHVT